MSSEVSLRARISQMGLNHCVLHFPRGVQLGLGRGPTQTLPPPAGLRKYIVGSGFQGGVSWVWVAVRPRPYHPQQVKCQPFDIIKRHQPRPASRRSPCQPRPFTPPTYPRHVGGNRSGSQSAPDRLGPRSLSAKSSAYNGKGLLLIELSGTRMVRDS